MKPVRDAIMRKLRFNSIDKAYKAYPNSKSFDVLWMATGRPIHNATWNMTLTPSLIINLIDGYT